jgi:hypothetical protein
LLVGSQLMVMCRKGERPECLRERGRGRHVGGLPWLGCSPGRRYRPGVSGVTSMTLELDSELEHEGLRCYRETEGSEVVPKVEGEEGTRAAAGICVYVFMDENQAKTMPVLPSGQIPKIIEENQAKNYA